MQEELERAVSALQDPTRRSILLEFYDDPRPRTVDEVAASAGVHRTVAFTHLERLRALGYLAAASRRGLPGKPARLYSLGPARLELSHPTRRFQLLGTLLAQVIGGLGKLGRDAVRQSGREFGRRESQHPVPAGRNPAGRALRALDGLGAEYYVSDDRIVAHNCVFQEACEDDVACELQAGILEGALEQAGIRASVRPDGREGTGCAYRVKFLKGDTWPH